MPTRQGSIRLFRLFGITIYLSWTWLIVAYFQIEYRIPAYQSPIFGVLEYLTLFLLVLIHEFGHQLACRSVGGKTHDIVLWFLGGVAYVSPPQRPGAQLWSIVAGPLVNVIFIPILFGLLVISSYLGWHDTHPDLYKFIHTVFFINLMLLCFNMLPIYPLDGGQILRSLLWFVFGRASSLMAASIIGFIGMGGLLLLAGLAFFFLPDKTPSLWLGAISLFILMDCWSGLIHAQALARIAKLPRRDGYACPSCKATPPIGELWRCGKCKKAFDAFLNRFACPNCGNEFKDTACPDCGKSSPINDWPLADSADGAR